MQIANMTKINETKVARRENLRKLMTERGGPLVLAKRLGYRNSPFLIPLAGPNPTREISERTARAIEQALDLPELWLDEPHDGPAERKSADVNTETVASAIRICAEVCEELGVALKPVKFADLVTLAYSDAASSGAPVRVDFVRKLVQLMK